MKKYLIATLVLTGFTLHAFEGSIDFRHIESGGVGYNQGYSTLEFIGNQNWDKFELLLNLRGHVFNNGRLAGNAGFGLRKPFKSERYLFGLNAFYDVRNTTNLTAQQIGVGAEFLSTRADIRINGYIPFSKESDFEQKTFSAFGGHTIYVKQKAEIVLPCAEFEIGVPIRSIFYLAGGPYYLFKKKTHHMEAGNACGGKIRAVLDVTSFLALSAIVSYDPIFHTKVQGYISFNIPLDSSKPKKTTESSRNLRKVVISRNEIIPIQKKHRTVPLSEITSGSNLLSIIFVNNAFEGIGTGTFEAPFSSLKEAEHASKVGDVIYVLPGDGTSRNMEEGIVLKENQTLTSSSAPLTIDEVIVPPQTPGQKPVITNIHPDQPVITHAEGSHVEDAFTIMNPADYIFSDWDSPSYEAAVAHDTSQDLGDTSFGSENTATDLLGGSPDGSITTDLGEEESGLGGDYHYVGHEDAMDIDGVPHETGSNAGETSDLTQGDPEDSDTDSVVNIEHGDADGAPADTGGGGSWWSFW